MLPALPPVARTRASTTWLVQMPLPLIDLASSLVTVVSLQMWLVPSVPSDQLPMAAFGDSQLWLAAGSKVSDHGRSPGATAPPAPDPTAPPWPVVPPRPVAPPWP